MRIIGFTNGCFHGKNRNIFSVAALNKLKLKGTNALELSFDPLADQTKLRALLPELKKFKYISLHMSSRYDYSGGKIMTKILKNTLAFYQLCGAQLVVLHPDVVKNWQIFQKYPINWAVENMDSNKIDFQTVSSVGRLLAQWPKLKMVLDLNHCYENDPTLKLANDFIKRFKNKIKEIHLSGHQNSKKTHHGLLYQTKQKQIVLTCRKIKVPIIIESYLEHDSDIEKEFNYINKLLN